MILTPHLIVLVGIIFVTSTVSDNSYKLIRPELYPTTTDSPNESIANADVGGPFDVLKGKSFRGTVLSGKPTSPPRPSRISTPLYYFIKIFGDLR